VVTTALVEASGAITHLLGSDTYVAHLRSAADRHA
jgi:hypothetical protein